MCIAVQAGSLAWLILLIMFSQLPYDKEEAGPFYVLAKIWPVILAPLVAYGMLLFGMLALAAWYQPVVSGPNRFSWAAGRIPRGSA